MVGAERADKAGDTPPRGDAVPSGPTAEVSLLASDVKHLVQSGDVPGARERFAAIVGLQQRRAARIAYHFLRDSAEADEAVQDAFMKVFSHISSFREDL